MTAQGESHSRSGSHKLAWTASPHTRKSPPSAATTAVRRAHATIIYDHTHQHPMPRRVEDDEAALFR